MDWQALGRIDSNDRLQNLAVEALRHELAGITVKCDSRSRQVATDRHPLLNESSPLCIHVLYRAAKLTHRRGPAGHHDGADLVIRLEIVRNADRCVIAVTVFGIFVPIVVVDAEEDR